jgi:hypothetical protein
VRSSERLWLACRIRTLNMNTRSNAGRPPFEPSDGVPRGRDWTKHLEVHDGAQTLQVVALAESSFRRSSRSKNPA